MKKIVLAIAVVLTLGFTVTSCKSDQKEAKEVEKEVVEKEVVEKEVVEKEENKELAIVTYHCSMDCEKGKTYNKPGQCPVCKMDLKEKEAEGETDAHDHEGETEEQEG